MNLVTKYSKEAERIARSAEKIVEVTRDWQMIQEYMSNRIAEFELTERQRQKKERYQYIYNQRIAAKYSDPEIVNQLQSFYGISESQAYEDMNCSTKLFNSSAVNVIDKRFELKLRYEINKIYQRKCLELGNLRELARFEKNAIKILELIEEEEETNDNIFEGHTIEVTFNPELLGAPEISKEEMKDLMDQINKNRKKKINTEMFDELEIFSDGD